jgi:hypothetical protein
MKTQRNTHRTYRYTLEDQVLSKHFTLDEFVFSNTADKMHIDNMPSPEVLANLKHLAQYCEQVRAELGGVAMIITSGYRCPALNKAVGGAKDSRHLEGLACDFIATSFGTPLDICKHLSRSAIPFDQLILEYYKHVSWVHFGIVAPDQTPRKQVLTISRNQGIRVGLWKNG